MKNNLDELTQNIHNNTDIFCQRCKEKITDVAFIYVRGEIINRSKTANIFTCPEQLFNYAQGIVMHTCCYIDMLREYESALYDMSEVMKKYTKKEGD